MLSKKKTNKPRKSGAYTTKKIMRHTNKKHLSKRISKGKKKVNKTKTIKKGGAKESIQDIITAINNIIKNIDTLNQYELDMTDINLQIGMLDEAIQSLKKSESGESAEDIQQRIYDMTKRRQNLEKRKQLMIKYITGKENSENLNSQYNTDDVIYDEIVKKNEFDDSSISSTSTSDHLYTGLNQNSMTSDLNTQSINSNPNIDNAPLANLYDTRKSQDNPDHKYERLTSTTSDSNSEINYKTTDKTYAGLKRTSTSFSDGPQLKDPIIPFVKNERYVPAENYDTSHSKA